jgi:cytoskeletal protein CcmA (bactofilin family)
VIGEDSKLTGRVTGKDLTIHGRFEGTLEIKGVLRVARNGRVSAVVKAHSVEVDGEFDGEIRAQSLAFDENARAKGVFVADKLRIREGARVDGAVNLTVAAAPAPATASAPAPTPTPAPAPVPVPQPAAPNPT